MMAVFASILTETSDFRIVKVRRVRNIEVDKRQPDGWVGGVAPRGREQRLIFGEVTHHHKRSSKRAGAGSLVVPHIPKAIG
jgi:hypothetical protein